jgi:hypothetical protein
VLSAAEQATARFPKRSQSNAQFAVWANTVQTEHQKYLASTPVADFERYRYT